jgi:iron(III) transport system permease protein
VRFVARDRPAETPLIRREGRSLLTLVAVLTVLFALWPFIRLVIAAIAPRWTLDLAPALAEIARRSSVIATWNTIEAGTLSALFALLIGASVAIVLALTDVRGRRPIAFLFVLSTLMAPQVVALAFLLMSGPSSPLLNAIGLAPPAGSESLLMGRAGVILLLSLHHAPLVFVTVTAGLRALPREVIEAANLDGADGWRAVRHVVLPLIRPHLIAAALLAFVAAVGNFGIPALLGMPVNYLTLPTLIFRRISSFGPSIIGDAAALSILVALIAGAGVLASAWFLRRAPAPLSALESASRCLPLGRWRLAVEGMLWGLIGLVVVLPLLSLLAAALVPTFGVILSLQTVTLDKFVEVLWRQPVTVRAFLNSFGFALGAAILLVGLAILTAYGLDRHAGRWRRPAEALIEIPYALPGIVLAIACILIFLRPLPIFGVSLYATPWIILFAYLARFLPMALKPALAAMGQLSPEQEEAAAVFGAGFWQRLRHIVVPMVLPSAVAGGLLVFLTAFNELTVSALLWTAGTETLGVVLFNLEEAGLASEAAAVALSATGVIVLVMLLLDRLHNRLPTGVLPWR